MTRTSNVVALRPEPATTPTPQKGKVPPIRRPNAEVRSREYLTPAETDALMNAARKVGRHGHRDATLNLIAYRHGFRVSELASLRWDQVDLSASLIHVNRLKNGRPSSQPLRGPELRALRKLDRGSLYVFTTERQGPMTASNVRKIVARAGRLAGIPFPVHPHMLRHACGYKLANEGHDTRAIQQYLGHRNITRPVYGAGIGAVRRLLEGLIWRGRQCLIGLERTGSK